MEIQATKAVLWNPGALFIWYNATNTMHKLVAAIETKFSMTQD